MTKIVAYHHQDWALKILEALWACRKTWQNTTRFSPFELVYGKSPLFPIEFEISTLRTTLEVCLDLSYAKKHRLAQLNELDEIRSMAI